jgi:hypothetical protein
MNFRRRLTGRRIRNLRQTYILDSERKPKRCTNLSSRFLSLEQQRIWICDEHYRMHHACKMTVVVKRDQ